MGPAAARRGEFQLLWLMQKIGLQIVLINSAPNVASFQMSNVSRQTLFKNGSTNRDSLAWDWSTMWPEKNRQKSIKVAQKW